MRALNWHLHAPDSLRPRKLAELMKAPSLDQLLAARTPTRLPLPPLAPASTEKAPERSPSASEAPAAAPGAPAKPPAGKE